MNENKCFIDFLQKHLFSLIFFCTCECRVKASRDSVNMTITGGWKLSYYLVSRCQYEYPLQAGKCVSVQMVIISHIREVHISRLNYEF